MAATVWRRRINSQLNRGLGLGKRLRTDQRAGIAQESGGSKKGCRCSRCADEALVRMKKLWYKANPSFLAKMKTDVEKEYPDLRVFEKGNTRSIVGTFPLVYEGETVDQYEIELRLLPDFPDSIPAVRETGGRIPRKDDRHVSANGDACPIVPEEWLLRPDCDSVVSFLNGPVRNFLLGQSLVEEGQPWPLGRGHTDQMAYSKRTGRC